MQPTERQQIFCVLLTQSIFIHVLLIMLTYMYYYWFGAARSVLHTTVNRTMWYLANKEEYVVYHLIYCRRYMCMYVE